MDGESFLEEWRAACGGWNIYLLSIFICSNLKFYNKKFVALKVLELNPVECPNFAEGVL
jgi:hypothetical protein